MSSKEFYHRAGYTAFDKWAKARMGKFGDFAQQQSRLSQTSPKTTDLAQLQEYIRGVLAILSQRVPVYLDKEYLVKQRKVLLPPSLLSTTKSSGLFQKCIRTDMCEELNVKGMKCILRCKEVPFPVQPEFESVAVS